MVGPIQRCFPVEVGVRLELLGYCCSPNKHVDIQTDERRGCALAVPSSQEAGKPFPSGQCRPCGFLGICSGMNFFTQSGGKGIWPGAASRGFCTLV